MDKPGSSEITQLVDHLFRNEAARITAILTKLFGLHRLELAEDIVQETLLEALNRWSVGKIPENPSAWLIQVAKRKTINFLKREQYSQEYTVHERHLASSRDHTMDDFFDEHEISDSQLRMIFACCHPELPRESQIALALKTLCGFSVPEISHALLTTKANVDKRLYRAKQKFREGDIQFELPSKDQLEERLDSVYLAIYLLFNAGYNASHDEKLIREDICVEAIRLLVLLTEHIEEQPKAYALLSLMYLHAARFDARLDKEGGIIIFEDQDRGLWDQDMIATGVYFLNKSAFGDKMSAYHLEASIAALHCMADSFETTDWPTIYRHYERLYQIKRNPVILLNLAIIQSKTEGVEASLQQLKELQASGELTHYYLLPATIGKLLLDQGRCEEAKSYFTEALGLTKSSAEIKYLQDHIARC